ncbi:MAG: hypothetical protein IKM42_07200 [Clostridia bacterium]|nr:hypothetical protein [Clostridia bacterium]MBR3863418.1 hypothetical protein [Clostridia bacterium]
MKTIFGVSSMLPSNQKLKNGYTMYDWVMRQKCFPTFWGRGLLGPHAITEEEVAFLRSKNCKIMLVVQDLTEAEVSGSNGVKEAFRVVESARKLNVPQDNSVTIFAEFKPDWSVNHNWMIGFAGILSMNGYIPGFIGNTDSAKNFNFDRQCSHYVQATEKVNQFGAVYMATEPKCSKPPQKWKPFCPSALNREDMHLWKTGTTTFDKFVVEDIYARDKAVLDKIW